MNAASCASGGFNPYLRGVAQAAEALIAQARDAWPGMSGPGHESQGHESHGQEHQERPGRRGAPWARRGGPTA
ncbi:MAG TPA: hypothetical protein VIF35_10885, partial [Streptosporangiaceae bacterium]